MECKVSIADKSHALEVYEIFIAARSQMTYLPQLHTKDETKEFIKGRIEGGHVYLAKKEGKACGFIEFDDKEVHHLYVHPKFQNLGVGKDLLDFAKKNSKILSLWVFEQNEGAIRFYEREGFSLVEKRDQEHAVNEENLPDRRYRWRG